MLILLTMIIKEPDMVGEPYGLEESEGTEGGTSSKLERIFWEPG